MTERAALAALLGAEVRFAVRAVGEVPVSALARVEREAVAAAVEQRQREMAAGRDAARDALAQLGHPPAPIPRGPGGAPAWPPTIVGSITHTRRWALAAVARSATHHSIGVDAEPAEPLEAELWSSITTAREVAELRRSPHGAVAARRLFCAKEAAYKCQYPLSQRLLEFGDLEVAWEADRFIARFTVAAGPFAEGDEIAGEVARIGDRWIAFARL